MQLLPASPPPSSIFRRGPFPLAHDRESRAVDNEMQAGTCGGATQREVEMLATPEPQLNACDRADVPHRPERRAVTAHAAAVQRGRDQARTVRVGEVRVGRTAQVEPARK